MKRFLFFLLPVMLIFLLSVPVLNSADVPNKTINVVEGAMQVVFWDSVTFGTDSVDNLTTQAISDDGWLDWENATLRVWSAGTAGEDVNFTLLGGATLDLTFMTSLYTQTVFDDINSATPAAWWACKDTILSTVANGSNITWFVDPVAGERFKVLKFDGQTGNLIGTYIYYYLVVPKKPGAPRRNAYGIFDTT
jgi:hypothetical protein